MIEQTISDLKREEGWRPHVYEDHLEFQTIGFGFLVDERRGGGMPPMVGDFWIRYLVDRITHELAARWTPFEAQPDDVRRALVLMAYQLGVDGLLGFKLMLASLARGDRETAAENAITSEWHKQTPARADRVAAIIRGS